MKEERKKQLKQLVDEHGLRGAAKLIGLTQVELVVELNLPIDYKLANQLLFDLYVLGKLPDVYREYEIMVDKFNSTFEWRLDSETDYYGDNDEYKEAFGAYATPFWDGSDDTPVEAIYYVLVKNDETIIDREMVGDYFESLKSVKEFKNLEHLLVWYRDFYLPNVYYILNRVFLRDIREESKVGL
jgi:hypothetical protein